MHLGKTSAPEGTVLPMPEVATVAWNPTTEEVARGVEAEASETFVAWVRVVVIKGLRGARDVEAKDGVVGHVAVAWPHLQGADGQVRVGVARENKHLVLVGHVPAVLVRLGHRQHEVGFADLASLRILGQPGVVCGIAFRFACGHPCAERGQFVLRQHPFPHKVRVRVVRRPWGHVPRSRDKFDEFTVRKHLFVRRQRHGADFTGTVAFGAMLKDNRRHVKVEGGGLGVGEVAQSTPSDRHHAPIFPRIREEHGSRY